MDWFKTEKTYVKTVYCHPAYLTYLQSTSCKMLGWMNHKLLTEDMTEEEKAILVVLLKKMRSSANLRDK